MNKSETALSHGRRTLNLEPGAPLWKRAPGRDASGQPLADFMMIIPRLGTRSAHAKREAIARIEAVLYGYGEEVVFADLNLRLNVLWVTLRPAPGLCLEVSAAIHACVPEARLVAQQPRSATR